MPEEFLTTAFSDIADVVSVKTDDQLPMVVGGHAINIWALAYSSRLRLELKSFAPFTTKDLDIWGSTKVLNSLAQRYNVDVVLSPPRSPGIGYVIIVKGDLRLKVELLTGVRGIRRIEEQNGVQLTILGTKVRVLDAVSCLKAKIANAAEIDQSGRQDVKHVKIIKLCAREFIVDMITQATQGKISERLTINYLEDLRQTITSPKAEAVTKKWGVSFENVMPIELIRRSTMEKVRNFAHFRLDPSDGSGPKIDFTPRQDPDGPKMSI